MVPSGHQGSNIILAGLRRLQQPLPKTHQWHLLTGRRNTMMLSGGDKMVKQGETFELSRGWSKCLHENMNNTQCFKTVFLFCDAFHQIMIFTNISPSSSIHNEKPFYTEMGWQKYIEEAPYRQCVWFLFSYILDIIDRISTEWVQVQNSSAGKWMGIGKRLSLVFLYYFLCYMDEGLGAFSSQSIWGCRCWSRAKSPINWE